MRDVCARTGLPRSTIHHYIREGVLPRPTVTGRNTALYDEDFVRRANLVKTLQEKTHLPLASIRETLNGMPDAAVDSIDVERLTGVTRTIAESLRLASSRELSSRELCERTGFKEADLDGMAEAGLIDPITRDGATYYTSVDARIALALARFRDAGVTPERGFVGSPQIARAYRKYLTELAKVEAREMVRLMRSLAGVDVEELVSIVTEPLGVLVAAMHHKALVEQVGELVNNGRS
jgi:DNA-binding transcriptional MerR regulator